MFTLRLNHLNGAGDIDMAASIESTWNITPLQHPEVARPRPLVETLADRLRVARRRRALSQEALAVRASTSREVIQKIENGKSLRPRKIVAIAKALDVEPSWLMFGGNESLLNLSSEAIAIAKAWSELSEPERDSVRSSLMRLTNGDTERN
jgi:transcriptional regulator with XRE-family HTH domain